MTKAKVEASERQRGVEKPIGSVDVQTGEEKVIELPNGKVISLVHELSNEGKLQIAVDGVPTWDIPSGQKTQRFLNNGQIIFDINHT